MLRTAMVPKIAPLFILLCGLVWNLQTFAQTGTLSDKEVANLTAKGQKFTTDEKYGDAAKVYQELAQHDPSNLDYQLALCGLYLENLGRIGLAEERLKKAEAIAGSDKRPEMAFYQGEFAFQGDQIEDALQKFLAFDGNAAPKSSRMEKKAKRRIRECNLAIEHRMRLLKARVVNVGEQVNSNFADYIPVVDKDEKVMFFTSRRNINTGNKKDKEDQQYYEDMYVARRTDEGFEKSQKVNESGLIFRNLLNTDEHESPVFLSYDEKTMISYRDNMLWTAAIVNDTIQAAVQLPKAINRSPYQPHASLTADGKTMYFSSLDKNANKDGENLNLYTAKLVDGKWDQVELLSNVINTPFDEDSPVISADGKTLYFSTKGHNGLGGYDVFKSTLVEGAWSTPVSMGEPINSGADDIYFKPTYDEQSAYFASSRLGGFGDMDIYRVEFFNNLFADCPPTERQSFPVDLDGNVGYTSYGDGVKFEWETGDGSRVKGSRVTYEYKKPGTYLARLIAVMPDGVKRYTSTSLEIVIGSQVNYLAMDLPDTIVVDRSMNIDAAGSQAENGDVMDYFWRIDKDLFFTGVSSVNHAFQVPGEHWVSLEVVVSEEGSLERETSCISKSVTVLSKEDWIAYAKAKTKQDVEQRLLAANERIIPLEVDEPVLAVNQPDPKKDDKLVNNREVEVPRVEIGANEDDLAQAEIAFAETRAEDAREAEELLAAASKEDKSDTEDGEIAQAETPDVETPNVDTPDTEEPDTVDPTETDEIAQAETKTTDTPDPATTVTTPDAPKTEEPTEKDNTQVAQAEVPTETGQGKTQDQGRLDPDFTKGLDLDNVPDLALKDIPFAFDKYRFGRTGFANMMENLQTLKDNPSVVIKITAHTDSRGSNKYNEILSENRARAVADFFIKNGIDKNRILAVVNVGETQLLNDCGDDSNCPEELHRKNRRAEIRAVATRK